MKKLLIVLSLTTLLSGCGYEVKNRNENYESRFFKIADTSLGSPFKGSNISFLVDKETDIMYLCDSASQGITVFLDKDGEPMRYSKFKNENK